MLKLAVGKWSLHEMSNDNLFRATDFAAKLTEAFDIERGLRQRNALSTILFNVVLEKVIGNIETNCNGMIVNKMRQCTAYGHDVFSAG